jgi:hypothetical protein
MLNPSSDANFLVDNIYVVIKSSQTTQLYITKVFDTQFSCYDYIRKIIFVTNLDKINIFCKGSGCHCKSI